MTFTSPGNTWAKSKQLRKKCEPYNIKYVFNFRLEKLEFKELKSPLELLLGVNLAVQMCCWESLAKGGGEGLIK